MKADRRHGNSRLSRAIKKDVSMTSVFGWVATDAEQRRRMMEVVDQFRDSTTIDDLGLGGIRDAFSDTLFPGTSTLHTRIRYALLSHGRCSSRAIATRQSRKCPVPSHAVSSN